jgi:WD40 repeat protein
VAIHDNLFVTGCTDHLVRLWDPRSGECIAKLDGHTADVNSVEYVYL